MNFVLVDTSSDDGLAARLEALGLQSLKAHEFSLAARRLCLYYSPGDWCQAWDRSEANQYRLVLGQVATAPRLEMPDADSWHKDLIGCYVAFEINPSGISCISDAVCSAPIYYLPDAGAVLASSRLDWLLKLKGGFATLDYSQVLSFLFAGAGTCPGSKSLFREAQIAPPCSRLNISRIDGGWRFDPDPYWEVSLASQRPSAVDELGDILEDSVRHWMTAKPRPVFSLTGGYDSRLILAVAHWVAQRDGRRLNTVTVGESDVPDVVRAALPAQTVGSEHAVWMFSDREYCAVADELMAQPNPLHSLTSGQGRHSNVSQYWINRRIREAGFDCDFNGCGGQAFKGLDYGALPGAEVSRSLFGSGARLIEEALQNKLFCGLAQESLKGLVEYFFREAFSECPADLDPRQRADWYYLAQQNPRTWGPRHHFNLQTSSICFPFYRQAFMAKVAEIPSSAREDAGVHRALISRFCPELGRSPFHSANLPRPHDVGGMDRLTRFVRRRILRRTPRQFGHYAALRKKVKDRWIDTGRRVADCLPSLGNIPRKLRERPLLIGGSPDLRLYYFTHFVADLIDHGVSVRE